MGEREIRAEYGGHLAKAINRAMRAEVPGGNEALEQLTQLAGAARQSRWKDARGRETPEAAAYVRHRREVVGRMDAEVRKRWGVPPAAAGEDARSGDEATRSKSRSRGAGKPRPGGRGPAGKPPRRQGPAREAGKRETEKRGPGVRGKRKG